MDEKKNDIFVVVENDETLWLWRLDTIMLEEGGVWVRYKVIKI